MSNRKLRQKFKEVENEAQKGEAIPKPLSDIEKFDNGMLSFIKFLVILFIVVCTGFVAIASIGGRDE